MILRVACAFWTRWWRDHIVGDQESASTAFDLFVAALEIANLLPLKIAKGCWGGEFLVGQKQPKPAPIHMLLDAVWSLEDDLFVYTVIDRHDIDIYRHDSSIVQSSS